MLEILYNKVVDCNYDRKNYYWFVYQLVREKMELLKDYFKDFVVCLLGDKDYERVLDIVFKVEKKLNCKKF